MKEYTTIRIREDTKKLLDEIGRYLTDSEIMRESPIMDTIVFVLAKKEVDRINANNIQQSSETRTRKDDYYE